MKIQLCTKVNQYVSKQHAPAAYNQVTVVNWDVLYYESVVINCLMLIKYSLFYLLK